MRAIVILLTLAFAFPQNGYDLFQQALVKERAEGKVDEAIRIYEQIIKDYASNRALVEKAQEALNGAKARLTALEQTRASGRASGTRTRLLWSSAELIGTVFPDGQYVSMSDNDTGELAVVDAKTRQKRLLTKTSPQWSEFADYTLPSPDGRMIAYMWLKGQWELRTIQFDREGQNHSPRVLYRNAEVLYPTPHDWTRDGKQILMLLSKKDRTNQIAFLSVADGSVRVVKTLDWRSPSKMYLSPDGRYLAYDFPVREDAPARDIFILASDGSREIHLIDDAANDRLLGWTPDGKRILFLSDRTGRLDAWAIAVDNGRAAGKPELVQRDIGRAVSMGFTRNGAFYYGRDGEMEDVWIGDVNFEEEKIIAPPEPVSRRFVGANDQPAWSADGKQLVYISQRGFYGDVNFKTLVIRSMETGEERDVTPQMKYFQQPVWASDGKSVFIRGTDNKGGRGLYQVELSTGNTGQVWRADTDKDLGWMVPSPDRKLLYFSKGSAIVSLNLATWEERELVRDSSIKDFGVSPDGNFLAFHAPFDNEALKVVSTTTGEVRELGRFATRTWVGFGFTRDSRYVIFVKNENPPENLHIYRVGKVDLWKISIDGGFAEETECLRKQYTDPPNSSRRPTHRVYGRLYG